MRGGADLDPRLGGGLLRRPLSGFELRADVKPWPSPRDGEVAWVGPLLVAREGGWKGYEPLKTRRLPQEVRRLASELAEEPNLSWLTGAITKRATGRVVAFADRYGFLSTPAAVVDASGAWAGYGEPVAHWLNQLAVFHHALIVWDRAVNAARGSELFRRNLEAVVPRADDGRRIDLGPAFEFLQREDLQGRPLHEVVADRLRVFVSSQLNSAMHVTLEPGKPLRFRPSSVLAAVYLDFALELVGGTGARLRECDYCHNQYLASRSDKRFCSDTCRSQARYTRQPTLGTRKEATQ